MENVLRYDCTWYWVFLKLDSFVYFILIEPSKAHDFNGYFLMDFMIKCNNM